MKVKLSENIRRFRREEKLTQEQLAEAMGVSVSAVYKWESGQSAPELCVILITHNLRDSVRRKPSAVYRLG